MSSTETPSAQAESPTALLDSIQLNSMLGVITNADLPFEVAHDLWSYVLSLVRCQYPASALRELPELLAAITDAVALALSSTAATGQTSPSAKASPSPTSAETGAVRDGGTGAQITADDVRWSNPILVAGMINDLRAQLADATKRVGELEDGLADATAHLAGATSAYKIYAGNSERRSIRDAFYKTRLNDFEKSLTRARALLQSSPSKEDPDVLAAKYGRGGHHA
jgi:hypothetical protein